MERPDLLREIFPRQSYLVADIQHFRHIRLMEPDGFDYPRVVADGYFGNRHTLSPCFAEAGLHDFAEDRRLVAFRQTGDVFSFRKIFVTGGKIKSRSFVVLRPILSRAVFCLGLSRNSFSIDEFNSINSD